MNPQPIRQKGKYSQNDEDYLIERYFRGKIGTILSIGENDGKTFSNVLSAIERGWQAVLIEPSKTAFEKLTKLHEGNANVMAFNIAIGKENGKADFYESGEHIGNGDTSLISTLNESELGRWKGSKYDNFTKTTVDVNTWEMFYSLFENMKFNLISIDAEGYDLFILQQMDLLKMDCEMLIVEYNGVNETEYSTAAANGGLRLLSKNFENLIYAR